MIALAFAAIPSDSSARPVLIRFDIEPQPLAKALVEFAVQADVSVGRTGVELGDARGGSVAGLYSTESALRQLLAGTGFRFEFVDSQTIRILKGALKDARAPGPRVKPAVFKPALTPIEEVVITATKQEGTVQSLPYSVAVMTGTRIRNLGVSSFDELALRFAGVTVTNLGAGRNKVFVRGLSDGTFSGRTQSTVGVYLDDSRVVFSAPNPDVALIDIERVEVVRGPQGTLYGAGTIGGLFRIVTNKPDLRDFATALSTSGSTTRSGGINSSFHSVLNIPVKEDVFGVRLVAYHQRESGYIDDIRLEESDVNFADISGGRLTALLKISDTWSVTAGMTFQEISADDGQYYQQDLGRLNRANFLEEPHGDDFYQYHLTVNAELSWADLVSSTSLIRRRISDVSDASLAVPVLVGLPITRSPFAESRRINSFNHESRLTSKTNGNLHWLAGVFFSQRAEGFDSTLTVPGSGLFLTGDPVASDIAFLEDRDDDVSEIAVFGEATWDISDRFSVVAGLRWFRSVHDAASTTDGAANMGLSFVEGRNEKSDITPKLVFSFELNDDFMAYAQASQGYRVGGININSPINSFFVEPGEEADLNLVFFDSDKLWNFEFGLKTRWFDRRLVLNVGTFYTIWKNVQSDQVLGNGFVFTTNAGDARNLGVEVDLVFRLSDQFDIQANFVWNEPELTEVNPFLDADLGNSLPAIPEISFGVSGHYEVPINSKVSFYFDADYAFVGASKLTFDEESAPTMGNYQLGNIRLGLSWSNWRMGIFVNNVADTGGNTFSFGNSFSFRDLPQVTPPRPRTIGMTLTWDS